MISFEISLHFNIFPFFNILEMERTTGEFIVKFFSQSEVKSAKNIGVKNKDDCSLHADATNVTVRRFPYFWTVLEACFY